MKRLSMLSLDQVKKLNQLYCFNGIPEIPEGYEFDGFLTDVDQNTLMLSNRGGACAAGYEFHDTVVIGLKKKKKYRFVCDDPKPRVPSLGDFIFISVDGSFLEVLHNDSTRSNVIFRREEFE